MYNNTVLKLYTPLRYVRSALRNIKHIPVPYKDAHPFLINMPTRYCINQNILYLMQYCPLAQPQSVAPVCPLIAVESYLA